MDLDPRQTNAVRAVIENGSFEQAAVKLHLTPSAVSQRVRALEARLGGPLVVRTRPCRATSTGQRLLQHLRRAALLEDDFESDLASADASAMLPVSLAVNADTLATWFMPALSELLVSHRVLLDLSVADQDHTYALLAAGHTVACISTESRAMRGCIAERLGRMRYRLVASPAFVERWFPQGLKREPARLAPVIAATRKDTMQSRFLEARFGLPADAFPSHYIPAPGPRYDAIRRGLGYGMVPELHLAGALESGSLIDLARASPSDVELFWHTWKLQSPRLEHLSGEILALARRALGARPNTNLMENHRDPKVEVQRESLRKRSPRTSA
jgi:LysR family transcriptional regulator (chromosome initiation inhibitor)